MPRPNGLYLSSVLAILVALGMLVSFQFWNDQSEEAEIHQAVLVGQTHEYHNLLEMSAQMSVKVREPQAEKGYVSQFRLYNQTITELRNHISQPSFQQALGQTRVSQQQLTAMHLRAMELCQQGQCLAGKRLLDSRDYRQRRLVAEASLDKLIQVFEEAQMTQNDQTQTAFVFLEWLLVLVSLMLLGFWHRNHTARMKLLIVETRIETLRVTMRTVMDVVNNNLNRLRLLQVRWKKQNSLNMQELQDLGALIRETSACLTQIGDLETYRTHGEGPAELLQWQTQPDDKAVSPSITHPN